MSNSCITLGELGGGNKLEKEIITMDYIKVIWELGSWRKNWIWSVITCNSYSNTNQLFSKMKLLFFLHLCKETGNMWKTKPLYREKRPSNLRVQYNMPEIPDSEGIILALIFFLIIRCWKLHVNRIALRKEQSKEPTHALFIKVCPIYKFSLDNEYQVL